MKTYLAFLSAVEPIDQVLLVLLSEEKVKQQ
jgi:hypothetical protein